MVPDKVQTFFWKFSRIIDPFAPQNEITVMQGVKKAKQKWGNRNISKPYLGFLVTLMLHKGRMKWLYYVNLNFITEEFDILDMLEMPH